MMNEKVKVWVCYECEEMFLVKPNKCLSCGSGTLVLGDEDTKRDEERKMKNIFDSIHEIDLVFFPD